MNFRRAFGLFRRGLNLPWLGIVVLAVSPGCGKFFSPSTLSPSDHNPSNYSGGPSGSPTLVNISISPEQATISLGETQSFYAVGVYSDTSTQDLTNQVAWSSDNTSIVGINQASGVASSVGTGTAHISASLGSVVSASAALTVTAATLVSLDIEPRAASISSGETQAFTVTATYSDGSTHNYSQVATYVLGTQGIVSVDGNGVATGLAVGSSTISAQVGNITSPAATISVTTASLVKIAITPNPLSVAAGQSQQLTATGTYSDGSSQDLTKTVVWSLSAGQSNATLTSSGSLSGVKAGSLTVMAQDGSVSGTETGTITGPVLTAVSLSAPFQSLNVGQDLQCTATGTYSDGSTQDLTTLVKWSSSQSAVTVGTNTGKATGVSAGSSVISVAAYEGVVASNQLTLTVLAVLQKLTITPNPLSLAVGQALQLTATGTYSDGSTKNLTSTVGWTVSAGASNAKITTSGQLTGVTVGSATITAQDGSVSGTETATITAPVLTGIALSAPSSSLNVGQVVQCTATGTYSDGSTKNLTSLVSWSSSKTAVTIGAATGLSTGVSPGGSTISVAAYKGVTASSGLDITVNPGAALSTVAGVFWTTFGSGGPATSAGLNTPQGVAIDSKGNFYIADLGAELVRKIDATTGNISIYAGAVGAVDSLNPTDSGDGGPATGAALAGPAGLAFDSNDNLYIAEYHGNCVRMVNAATGIITTVAGKGSLYDGYSGDGGPATQAMLQVPSAVAVDGTGNLYIADSENNVIRKVNPQGIISTVAGSVKGDGGDGGPATSAMLNFPNGVAVDVSGNLYIADTGNECVRRVDKATGIITTVAGDHIQGYSNDVGPATQAQLNHPAAIALDPKGDLFISDTGNNCVRVVNGSSQNIVTDAGNGTAGFGGDGGISGASEVNNPEGLVLDAQGNIYFADSGNGRVREINRSTGYISTFAGVGTLSGYTGDGVLATASELNKPSGVVEDSSGTLYISDTFNARIRRVDGTTHKITTFAGTGTQGYSGDGGPATSAELYGPTALLLDSKGNLYFSDTTNGVVRRIDATTNVITTVAGTIANFSTGAWCGGDGGPATSSCLSYPSGLAWDAAGNLYIADNFDNRVRKVDLSTGIITTIAGTGAVQTSGDGGPATQAGITGPVSVALDANGDLFIADTGISNADIRRVDAKTGIITTIAGGASATNPGDGELATAAYIAGPTGLFVKGNNLYFADSWRDRIRMINLTTGIITTVVGTGDQSYSPDGTASTSASLYNPSGVFIDASGNLLFSDALNNVIRKVPGF